MLLLGDFLFQDFEIPEKIPFPAKQALAVHKLIGGARVIDAMGSDPDPIKWTGRFQGGDAVGRARQLEAMVEAGQQVQLVCGEIARTVVVESFTFDYERPYQGPYEICCVVIPDEDQADPTLDDVVGSDMTSATNALSGTSARGAASFDEAGFQ